MGHLTLANQLTILRIMLIPVFVLLVVYGFLGWALVVFLIAGITDALDGLIARWTDQRTSLGAWLDPMADKLLLVTTFTVLTLPGVPPIFRCILDADFSLSADLRQSNPRGSLRNRRSRSLSRADHPALNYSELDSPRRD